MSPAFRLILLLPVMLGACSGASSATPDGAAGSGGGAGTGGGLTKDQNHWLITVSEMVAMQQGTYDVHQQDYYDLVSAAAGTVASVIDCTFGPEKSLNWKFPGDVTKKLPYTASDATGNFTSFWLRYVNGKREEWYCGSASAIPTGVQAGTYSITITSAVAQPTVGADKYLFHGTMHAVCPGTGTPKTDGGSTSLGGDPFGGPGMVTVDATF